MNQIDLSMKKIAIIGILVLWSLHSTFATNRDEISPSSTVKGKVEGVVKVKEKREPLEYANIVLYSKSDSSIVNGTVTNVNGRFMVEDVPLGKYYLEVDFIGFKKQIVDDLNLTRDNRIQDLGTIYVEQAAQELESVEVTGDRMQVEYKIDRKVINVSKNLNAQGGTAVDALENVPSIQTDIEGNVELRGSSNFRVLIDGKPTVLDGSDALQQIPANMIKNIEIITNPSAKYDPEGTAGIINIIMKKNKQAGVNGIVRTSAGTGDKYDGSVNLNYRMDKLNVFVAADYRDFNFDMDHLMEQENQLNDTLTSFLNRDMTREMQRDGYSFKGGLDYYFTDKSTLSVSAKAGKFGFGFDNNTRITDYTSQAASYDYSRNTSDFGINHDYINLNLNFQQNFDEKEHKLEASGYFSRSRGDNSNLRTTFNSDANWNLPSSFEEKQRTNETNDRDRYQANIDYTRPLSFGKLEAGYQMRYRKSSQDYLLENYFSDQWMVDSEFSNDMELYRHMESVYSTLSGKAMGIGYKLGLRGEYTDRLLDQVTLNKEYRIQRFDLFPSAHFSKQLSKGQQLNLSYSRRIRRPRGWFINPFKTFTDDQAVRYGNPDLEPEYTDSYEMGYKKTFKRSFVSAEAYFRQTNNKITRVNSFQGDTLVSTFDNLNRDYSMGVELMANMDFFKWWRLNATANVYKYYLDGQVAGEDVSANSNNWSARLNNTFKLNTGTRIQLMAFYMGPSVTAQGERESFFMTSAAVKQSFLNRKLNVTLSVRDLFGSMEHEFTSEGPDFYIFNRFTRESPVVNLSISYTLNNYKPKRRDRSSEGNEFEGMEQF